MCENCNKTKTKKNDEATKAKKKEKKRITM